MKYFISMLVLACMVNFVSAQSRISGRVTDASNGGALVGASISISGRTGAVTGRDGSFSIACTGNTAVELVVSFIGYETKRLRIRNCSDAGNITLTPSRNDLDKVEITATTARDKSMLE